MKIEHYCYTRGAEMDYDVFSSPNNLTKSQLDIVKSKHLSILGDDVERNLKTPKWILYKDTDFLFWGVCCENRLIASDDRMTAHKNRPIRGFFSIVITKFDREDLKIPFDINYFRELYRKEVEPYWNQSVQHQNKTTGFIAGSFNYIGAVHNDYVSLLNTDTFQCQSLGELDKDGVIAAALTLDNVSLLIDNDNIEQATNKKGSFMNCLSPFVGFGLYGVKQQCPKCRKYVSSFTSTGICQECRKSEDSKKTELKKKEKNMKEWDGIEWGNNSKRIEELETNIIELESNVKIISTQLKKTNLLVKILTIVSIALLIMLLCTQDSFSLKLFEGKQENPPEEMHHNYSDVKNQNQDFFKFLEDSIHINPCTQTV